MSIYTANINRTHRKQKFNVIISLAQRKDQLTRSRCSTGAVHADLSGWAASWASTSCTPFSGIKGILAADFVQQTFRTRVSRRLLTATGYFVWVCRTPNHCHTSIYCADVPINWAVLIMIDLLGTFQGPQGIFQGAAAPKPPRHLCMYAG